jgi:hypothetical protein
LLMSIWDCLIRGTSGPNRGCGSRKRTKFGCSWLIAGISEIPSTKS